MESKLKRYIARGIRTEKIVDGIETKYYLDGDKVIYETTGTNTLYYTYDAQDSLIGFKYNNTQYYYICNGQSDIIVILDNSLTQVISYSYDSWGKIVSIKDGTGTDVTSDPTSIGNISPYKYRGYRYDNETGMYYLQSRYYNPEFGRIINADGVSGQLGILLSHNLFAYCLNNPVNMYDPSGYLTISIFTLRVVDAVNFLMNGPAALPQPKSVVEKVVIQVYKPNPQYTNTVKKSTDGIYNVTTKIKDTNYNYEISSAGVVSFNFTINTNQKSDRNKLVNAMYDTTKSINKDWLK
ncbi:MAG: RHS repeat-associated core domain-containing protein [Clostridia bacterium]|nr:RHS repeat-associated core domain-containing protein [Clostridia bacterium]